MLKLKRCFAGALRLEVFLLSLGVTALLAPSAGAALKKYGVARQNLLHYSSQSPMASFTTSANAGSLALIDESAANPRLQKFVITSLNPGVTTEFPSLTNGFIFVTVKQTQGFEPSTGTGATSSSINWGNLGGWTLSGSFFCHSVPSYLCDLASSQDSATTDPAYLSSNYDVGTWTFHGTGWTTNLGIIARSSTTATGFGNLMYFYRGVRVFDATVSTLPLLGIGAVGVGVAALAAASVRKRGGRAAR